MVTGDNQSVDTELNDVNSQSNIRGSDFADLDGLLVNSENFNAVFVQRNNKQLLRRMLSRLSSSPAHLQKLAEILVNIIVNERHPEWTRRSLRWLNEIVGEPQLMDAIHRCRPSLLSLISHQAQLSGAGRLIETVSDMAMKGLKARPSPLVPSRSGLLDCGYVFVDDSDDNFGIPTKRSRMTEQLSKQNVPMETEHFSSVDSDSEVSLAYDSDEVDGEENLYADSADDGVFDVEDETSISDTQALISDLGRSPSSSHQNFRSPIEDSDAESANYCSSSDIESSEADESNVNTTDCFDESEAEG